MNRLAEYLAEKSKGEDIFVIQRAFEAQIETVFDMWTNKDHFQHWNGLTEAEKFSEIAQQKGVSQGSIFLENKATNTGENITLSYQLILEHKLKADRIILVQKPYMERRTYATFMKQWPVSTTTIYVTSPAISFANYPNEEISLESVINIMMGDLERIKVYPEKGFQIYQEIPKVVWSAFLELKERGYTKHLIK
jgi:uncharacterized SAM-binding protein YcdF (DUF218 family)